MCHSSPLPRGLMSAASGLTFDHSTQSTSIRLHVGKGDHVKQFEADANALRAYSTYFHRHLPRTSFPEELELPHEDPAAFDIFIGWCRKPKQPTQYRSGQYTDEPWISHAVAAWMLGNRLGAQRYETYALSQFIQNCAVMLDGPWKYIEDNVPNTSALSRFSNHWVAWNAYYSGRNANEYSGLFATRRACEVKPSTRDPRIFDLHHWYSDCGNNINPTCEHDPILKEQERQAELRRNRPAPEEWGAELEVSFFGRME